MAKSHKEAVGLGGEVEDGEASERTHTSDDKEHRVCERINNHETETAGRQVHDKATDTPNPHAKYAGLMRPVGTSHNPANELFGK